MTTAMFIVTKFEPVECCSACQRLALILGSAVHAQRILFTNCHGKERIEPQKIMIVKILVAGRQAKEALSHQLAQGVFDKERVALIVKATGQLARDPQALINLAQQ